VDIEVSSALVHGMKLWTGSVASRWGTWRVWSTDFGLCGVAAESGERVTDALRRRFGTWDEAEGDPHGVLPALRRYFVGDLDAIRGLPLDVGGTEFQRLVWVELQAIPPGETRTYAELAAAIGRPTAVRAVGAANGANPVSIVVPCHRVVGADGSLYGYAGGLPLKRALLAHEGVVVRNERQRTLF